MAKLSRTLSAPRVSAQGTLESPFLKRVAQRALNMSGYRIERLYPADYSPELISVIDRVVPFTMASVARTADTCAAIEYVVEHAVSGDIVECGVWRGGSTMAIALTLLRLGVQDRDLYLFDTFAGMPEPTDADVTRGGLRAHDEWTRTQDDEHNTWAYASMVDVEQALRSTGYDPSRVHLVKGLVEETIPDRAPAQISLLRLDTDWYESSKHELVHLFPRLTPGGVLILDDYGYWEGARQATDEYLRENGIRIMLHRSDASGRVGIKQP
jgi:O-methyltransferase